MMLLNIPYVLKLDSGGEDEAFEQVTGILARKGTPEDRAKELLGIT